MENWKEVRGWRLENRLELLTLNSTKMQELFRTLLRCDLLARIFILPSISDNF